VRSRFETGRTAITLDRAMNGETRIDCLIVIVIVMQETDPQDGILTWTMTLDPGEDPELSRSITETKGMGIETDIETMDTTITTGTDRAMVMRNRLLNGWTNLLLSLR